MATEKSEADLIRRLGGNLKELFPLKQEIAITF